MIATEASVHIERSPEDVFRFLSDPTNEPRWHTDVVEAEALTEPPLAVGSRERWVMSFMGRREQVMEVTRLEPNRLIELHGHPIMGLEPTITYVIEPDAVGARFTRRIEMEASGIGRLFAPMLKAGGPRRNRGFVNKLKAQLEQRADGS